MSERNEAFPVGEKWTLAQISAYQEVHPEDQRVLALFGEEVGDLTSDLPLDPNGQPVLGAIATYVAAKKGDPVLTEGDMQNIQEVYKKALAKKP